MMLQARQQACSARAPDQVIGVTILDLDRTLTRYGTYSPFLIRAAANEAPWRLALIPAVLVCMIAYRSRCISRKTLKEAMHRLMLGDRLPRTRVRRLADAFADHVAARGLYREALPLIARERDDGRVLILATAAHRFYAEAIARRLGIEHIVATESEWHEDTLRSRIVGENCHGPAKLAAVLAHLAASGWSRGDVHLRCYSDDASDLPSFHASDERFVVNPSRALAGHARGLGWSVLRFSAVHG